MKRPVVGVIGSAHLVENRFPAQRVGERNLLAVKEVAGALPLMFAGAPEITDIDALLDAVDGILLTGARANVQPASAPKIIPATNPTICGAMRWRWSWFKSASSAAYRCSACAAASRKCASLTAVRCIPKYEKYRAA
jgi:hypothetical protein